MNTLLINKIYDNSVSSTNDLNINASPILKELNETANIDEVSIQEQKDSISLDPKAKNIANKIKANNALNDAISETTSNIDERIHLSLEYGRIAGQMREQGLYVPDFNLNNGDSTTSTFLPFISQMKSFIKSSGFEVPSNFLNFCDKFEENLKKYDCY